jgi:hypothetical protein
MAVVEVIMRDLEISSKDLFPSDRLKDPDVT